jgi:transposase
VIVEKRGVPLACVLDSAQLHELTLAPRVLDAVAVPQPRGRPRKRPQRTVADRGYDSEPFRQQLRAVGIAPCIPKREWGRPQPLDKRTGPPGYRRRWIVERTFAWFGNERRLLVRHERLLAVYTAFFLVAAIKIVLRKFRNHRRK